MNLGCKPSKEYSFYIKDRQEKEKEITYNKLKPEHSIDLFALFRYDNMIHLSMEDDEVYHHKVALTSNELKDLCYIINKLNNSIIKHGLPKFLKWNYKNIVINIDDDLDVTIYIKGEKIVFGICWIKELAEILHMRKINKRKWEMG